MILSEYVFKVIRRQLKLNNIVGYNSLSPEEANYPLVVYKELSLNPLWSNDTNIEQIRIRFEVYANSTNVQDVIDIMKTLEILFNRTSYTFTEAEYGAENMCSIKLTESLGKDDEGFSKGIVDYRFSAHRNSDNTAVVSYSSSSSSTSSSSSSSD